MGACVNTKGLYICYFHSIQLLSHQTGPLRLFWSVIDPFSPEISPEASLSPFSFIRSKHDFLSVCGEEAPDQNTPRPRHLVNLLQPFARSLFLLRNPIRHLSSSAWRDNADRHTGKKVKGATTGETRRGKRERGREGEKHRRRELNR